MDLFLAHQDAAHLIHNQCQVLGFSHVIQIIAGQDQNRAKLKILHPALIEFI